MKTKTLADLRLLSTYAERNIPEKTTKITFLTVNRMHLCSNPLQQHCDAIRASQ